MDSLISVRHPKIKALICFLPMSTKHLIVIAGPTAVGKTEICIKLAQHLDCPILSADSRQFYQEMTVGTAKPSLEELNQAKHLFINTASVQNPVSAGAFEHLALTALEEIFKHKRIAILTGGSGLFLEAVYKGFDQFPSISQRVKNQVEKIYEAEGLKGLNDILKEKDPEYYESVDKENSRRLMRALEVCLESGQPYTSFLNSSRIPRTFKVHKIFLARDRKELYSRINSRVDQMIVNGLVQEVKSLMPFKHLKALQTVGYQELFPFLKSKENLDRCIELIKRNSRSDSKKPKMGKFRKTRKLGQTRKSSQRK